MKKIWVNKTYSFEDAERFDENYYLNMTSTETVSYTHLTLPTKA